MTSLQPIETRIQAYLRIAARQGRDTERIGPFLATISRHSSNPYLNYAMPEDGAVPTKADVAGLIDAYERRERTPRLEYVSSLAPSVEAALLAAGFVAEGRLPLLTCVPGQEHILPVPEGIELIRPVSDTELLGMVAAQNEAYGETAPNAEDVERLRSSLAAGAIAVLARDTATGEAAGAGICSTPSLQTTEVAGIGVRPGFRRRGIAGALTVRLTHEAFTGGVTLAFLMAAHESEAHLDARAGFREAGIILHISRPSPH